MKDTELRWETYNDIRSYARLIYRLQKVMCKIAQNKRQHETQNFSWAIIGQCYAYKILTFLTFTCHVSLFFFFTVVSVPNVETLVRLFFQRNGKVWLMINVKTISLQFFSLIIIIFLLGATVRLINGSYWLLWAFEWGEIGGAS